MSSHYISKRLEVCRTIVCLDMHALCLYNILTAHSGHFNELHIKLHADPIETSQD